MESTASGAPGSDPKALHAIAIDPPPPDRRASRRAVFAAGDEKKGRYHLPDHLDSASPVGYRRRVPLSLSAADAALQLWSMRRPRAFGSTLPPTEQELFEECSLGVLSSRQSTNYRGHRQVSFGPRDSARIATLLRTCEGLEADVLDGAAYTHVVLSRPYRTPFTMLLTLVGHKPFLNLASVPARIFRKRFAHADDIPTIGFLQHLHLGVLADAVERAAVIASGGRRRAQVLQGPFCGAARQANARTHDELAWMCGLSESDRRAGWRVALVAQVGGACSGDRIELAEPLWRKLGANLMAFRSERVLPGRNFEERATDAYKIDQGMNVPEELVVMAGRAAYNAFAHWTGCDRERSKELLLLDRIDTRTPDGAERQASLGRLLNDVTDRVIANLPLWAELPTGRIFSRNANRGRKAFALVGQRIYIAGLSRAEIAAEGLEWELAVRAVGAAASRSAQYVELMGCVDVPPGCDMLAGTCLMAGPVNQNDIGKEFFGIPDLLEETFGDRDPTSLLVWTLKAKTVADPIGNEEQLLDRRRRGPLVDLRGGPHDLVSVRRDGQVRPMRRREGRTNVERAFADAGNFAVDPEGREIPGNRGAPWPLRWRHEPVWDAEPTADLEPA